VSRRSRTVPRSTPMRRPSLRAASVHPATRRTTPIPTPVRRRRPSSRCRCSSEVAVLHLRFIIEGEAQVSRMLDVALKAATDLRPAWQEVVKDFHQVEAAQFGSQGSAGPSGAWAALSPEYAAWKARHGGGGILQFTRRMMESLTGEGGESIVDIEPMSLRLGTRNRVAGYHQRGTRRMPQRKVIDLPESFKKGVTHHIQRYIADQIQERR